MIDRIEMLKKDMLSQTRLISIERAKLYTESWQESEGDPLIIRRAKATANILDKVSISIRKGELIAGNRTILPRSGIISPEMDPYWIKEEMDTIYNRPQDSFVFKEEDKKVYRDELFPYWKGKSLKDFIAKKMTPEIQQAVEKNVFQLNQTDKGQGHIIMDFKMMLDYGVGGILHLLEEKLHQNPDDPFLTAGFIIYKALANHFLRYQNVALEQMSVEKGSHRKEELREIARICHKLSTEKPQSFYEALQLIWMTSIAAQYESNASSLSLGRMDQYLLPYYSNSLIEGTEHDFLIELLASFYVKTNDVVILRSESSAKAFAGFPVGYNIAIGGMNELGRSSVNPLSYLFLEALKEVKMPQPNLSVRINEWIPRQFLIKTSETIRLGTGMPQLFNDEVIIPGFLNRGVSLEDARDYAIVGCVELTIPGKTYGLHDIAMMNLLKIMELTIYELKDCPSLHFERVIEEIKNKISYYVRLITEGANIVDLGHRQFAPTPFLSTLIKGCLDQRMDVTEGGATYNFSGIQGIGEANISDSLYVLKKMVFENKEMSLSELVEALEANYQGEYEPLRYHVIHDFDKYGNDNDEVDDIAADIFRYYANELVKYRNIRGGIFTPGAYTVSAHIPLGEAVGATPDGRKAKEQLADGGLSPMAGKDRLGPTAVLKSVSKLDHYLTTNGSLLNLKFQPSSLNGIEGIRKFSAFLMAFVKLKIQHIQFNVQSRETLIDAQRNPEKYRGLVVRVAGYSAFFVDLNRAIQDDIIARTEHVI